MSPQESQALQDFLNQLTQARGIAKDPQADALIASAVAQQPDAAYLLVQRALLMDQALNAAKAQIANLQNQVQAAQAPARGFLDPANAWGNSATPASRPTAATPYPSAPMQQQAAAAYQAPLQAPVAASGFFGGGIGNVLGSVATTAAGVAGGAFLFQGIEHLMGNGGNHGSGLFGQQAAAAAENTTINNYYGDDNSSSGNSDSSDNIADSGVDSDDGSLA